MLGIVHSSAVTELLLHHLSVGSWERKSSSVTVLVASYGDLSWLEHSEGSRGVNCDILPSKDQTTQTELPLEGRLVQGLTLTLL